MSPGMPTPASSARLHIAIGLVLTILEAIRAIRILRVPQPTTDSRHECQHRLQYMRNATVMRFVLPQFRRNKIKMTSVVTIVLAVTAGVITLRQTFGKTTEHTIFRLSSASAFS